MHQGAHRCQCQLIMLLMLGYCRPAYYNELTGLYVPMSESSQTVVIGGGNMHMRLDSGMILMDFDFSSFAD